MSEHTPLTEAERTDLRRMARTEQERFRVGQIIDRVKADAYAAGLAARTSTATADTDRPAYGDVEAWKDNYDGMFQRWAECDTERLALKEEVRTLTLRLRIVEQDTATADTGLRERVEALAHLGVREMWTPDDWRAGLLRLLDATPASTEGERTLTDDEVAGALRDAEALCRVRHPARWTTVIEQRTTCLSCKETAIREFRAGLPASTEDRADNEGRCAGGMTEEAARSFADLCNSKAPVFMYTVRCGDHWHVDGRA